MKIILKLLILLELVVTPHIIRAAPGDIYEADFGSGTIFKFTAAGTRTVFASGLTSPSGLAFDAMGNLFVSDFGRGTIYKFTPEGVQSTFATGLSSPFGLAFDRLGNLFEADRSGQIFEFTASGTKSTFVSGLNIPAGLAFDAFGQLFESDFGSGTLFVFNPAKNTFASNLSFPNGLAFDGEGNLFESDAGSGSIFKFTPAGVKSTFATGLFQNPGLAFDDAGNLFVTENAAGTISKFTPGGTKTIFASGLSNPQYLAIVRTAPAALNISTRAGIQTGENVLIGGLIITGSAPKRVMLRGIGPSLEDANVAGFLADPTLELHEPDGTIVTNDNWRDTQEQEIIDTGIPPTNDLESAIIATLEPGTSTVIAAGKDGGTGVGLVEAYDLDQTTDSHLANISTRGLVETGDDVMIGGFIVGGVSGASATTIVVRAIGPSLAVGGVTNFLADPTLELHDSNGTMIAFNDNWKDSQEAQIEAAGLAPTDDAESAIEATLGSGLYTAVVRGKNDTTGVGLVEAYDLNASAP